MISASGVSLSRAISISVLGALLSATAFGAEDARTKAVREEVDHQLRDLVKSSPASLEVAVQGLASPDYALVSGSLALDGAEIPLPALSDLAHAKKVVFSGTVAPGPHTLSGQFVFQEAPNKLFTYMNGTKFKIPVKSTFQAQRGLKVRATVGAQLDPNSDDLQHRVKALDDVQAEMVATLDDGSMPPPPPKRVIPPAEVDAGTPEPVAATPPPPPPEPVAPAEVLEEPEKPSKGGKKHPSAAVAHNRGKVVPAKATQASPATVPALTVAAVATAPEPALKDAGGAGPIATAPTASSPTAEAAAPASTQDGFLEGLSSEAKVGIIGAIVACALVGLFLVLRRRR